VEVLPAPPSVNVDMSKLQVDVAEVVKFIDIINKLLVKVEKKIDGDRDEFIEELEQLQGLIPLCKNLNKSSRTKKGEWLFFIINSYHV